MQTRLTVKSGARPATLRLRLPTTIGRSSSANIKVKHHHISRKHCELFEKEGRLVVRDLHSANGTFVNGERIDDSMTIRSGDALTLGGVTFVVECLGGQRPAPAEIAPGDLSTSADTASVANAREDTHFSEEPPLFQTDDSAVLSYEELDDGSFVSIDFGEHPPTADAVPELHTDGLPVAEESRINLDVDEVKRVEDDSRLDSFLKGLGDDESELL